MRGWGRSSSSENGATFRNGAGWRNISIALKIPLQNREGRTDRASLCYGLFKEVKLRFRATYGYTRSLESMITPLVLFAVAVMSVTRGCLALRETNSLAQRQEPAKPATPQPIVSQQSAAPETAAKRQQNAAHSASCGSTTENDPAPKERKKPERDAQQEANELKRVQAAIAGATRGNWRDLRTVFEFAGITERSKEAPS
jgi:hypothetical protein